MKKKNKGLAAVLLILLVGLLLLMALPIKASDPASVQDDLQVLDGLPQDSVGLMKASDIAALLSLD